jgi:hypothetical protein
VRDDHARRLRATAGARHPRADLRGRFLRSAQAWLFPYVVFLRYDTAEDEVLMNTSKSLEEEPLQQVKRIGTGLCFVAFPAIWVFAFAVHPGLGTPKILEARELIARAHGNGLLQAAHALVTVNTALAIVVVLHFKALLDRTALAWAGLVGASLAVLGACALAADKGALCLTMSALDTCSQSDFAAMMPGLLAMFSFKGWLILVWGLVLLPIGVLVQTLAMLKTNALPRWQLVPLLVSMFLIGFPDGAEIVNLTAAILMAGALVPYGVRMILGPATRSRSST